MNLKRLITDDIPHIIWTLAFILPVALMPNALTVWWACQFYLPRELYDQWHGWPLGRGKIYDLIGWQVAAVLVTILYELC